jgi:hypothetical protein
MFWGFATPMWCVSGLLLLFAAISFLDAPNLASENQQERTALLKRAELVDRHLATQGRLPSKEEFTKACSDLHDRSTYEYELYTSRPEREDGFKFPQWPEGRPHFAIGYWRGEWSEFYDSNSRATTLDLASRVSCWVKEALWPLGASVVFGAPPFLALWFWRRHRMRSVQTTTVFALLFFVAHLPRAPELLR